MFEFLFFTNFSKNVAAFRNTNEIILGEKLLVRSTASPSPNPKGGGGERGEGGTDIVHGYNAYKARDA